MNPHSNVNKVLREGIESGQFRPGQPAPWTALRAMHLHTEEIARAFEEAVKAGLLVRHHDTFHIAPGLTFSPPSTAEELAALQRRLYDDVYTEQWAPGRLLDFEYLGTHYAASGSDLGRILEPLQRRALIQRKRDAILILFPGKREQDLIPRLQWRICQRMATGLPESRAFSIRHQARIWSVRARTVLLAFSGLEQEGLVYRENEKTFVVVPGKTSSLAQRSKPASPPTELLASIFEDHLLKVLPSPLTPISRDECRIQMRTDREDDFRSALDALARKNIVHLDYRDNVTVQAGFSRYAQAKAQTLLDRVRDDVRSGALPVGLAMGREELLHYLGPSHPSVSVASHHLEQAGMISRCGNTWTVTSGRPVAVEPTLPTRPAPSMVLE